MKKIGLTGGIGSGKTTVAEVFRRLGVPVFLSDDVARRLQEDDPKVKKGIQELFGDEIYADGKLDREKVAGIVFKDKKKLEQLNAIVHPAVAEAFQQFCEKHREEKYVLKEAAILFETGGNKQLDGMIVVTAPEALRTSRVMQRDGVSQEEVTRRMKNQWPEEEKVKQADFVIVNDEKELVIPQVVEVDKALRK
jgi:dephospho-CoA kinase